MSDRKRRQVSETVVAEEPTGQVTPVSEGGGGSAPAENNGDALYAPPAPDARPPEGGNSKRQETKAQKFRRLAERRLSRAIQYTLALIPLANRNQYEYGPDEVAQIVDALKRSETAVVQAFTGQQQRPRGFRFH